jgi:hypothetical protein
MKTTLWTYPWDVRDVGAERAANEIAGTGLQAVSMAATYHCFDQLRPRSKTKILTASRSAAYYPVSSDRFDGPLAPDLSDIMTGAEWSDCVDAFQKAGLGIVAWTLFLHNTHLGSRYPDLVQKTCTGDLLTHQLCPAHPAVRAYAANLAHDIGAQPGVDVLECESLSYGGYGHTHFHPKVGLDLGPGGRYLFSLCFCDACTEGGQSQGVDVDALRDRVSAQVDTVFDRGQPISTPPDELIESIQGLSAFAAWRNSVVTSLVEEVTSASGVPTRLLAMGERETSGLDIAVVASALDAVEYLCYTPDTSQIETTLKTAAAETGSPERVGVGLQAYPPASTDVDTLCRAVETARSCEVGLLSFYNYGIMPGQNLSWIEKALGG